MTPCSANACPKATVCDFDGTCRPLDHGTQTATSAMRLEASDWASVDHRRAGEIHTNEALLLGGRNDARILLTFDIPSFINNKTIQQAMLVLPMKSSSVARAESRIAVIPSDAFDGTTLTARTLPSPRPGPPVVVRVTPGSHPIRIDITALLTSKTPGPLTIQVQQINSEENAPWRLESPDTLDATRHPWLDLTYTDSF